MPADYFIVGSLPLLTAYVRAVDSANTIARLIRATDPEQDLLRYNKLCEMASRETKAMCAPAQKMRLAPSAGPDSRKLIPVAAGLRKPWQLTSRIEDE
jgi:hypothetical protein